MIVFASGLLHIKLFLQFTLYSFYCAFEKPS